MVAAGGGSGGGRTPGGDAGSIGEEDGGDAGTLTPASVLPAPAPIPRKRSTAGSPTLDPGAVFEQFSAHITEHRTHEGYLYKRGALLKGWKQRWFVLDSMKHQVTFLDITNRLNCKRS